MEITFKLTIAGFLERTFQDPDYFLSHTLLSNLNYDDKMIAVLAGPIDTSQAVKLKAEFSRLIHMIPDSPLFDDSTYQLWEVYKDILDLAVLPQQQIIINIAQPDEAMKAMLTRYSEIEKEYNAKIQSYRGEYAKENASADWRTSREPALVKELLNIQNRWSKQGYRNEVDEYYSKKAGEHGVPFLVIWDKWKNRFIPEIHTRSDENGFRYAVVSSDVDKLMKTSGWGSVSLDFQDLAKSRANIPKELRKRFGKLESIDELSFQYMRINVDRPWMVNEVFSSGFWNINPSNWPYNQATNGATVPVIPINSVIDEIFFVRNVAVTEKPSRLVEVIEFFARPINSFLQLFGVNTQRNKAIPKRFDGTFIAAFRCRKISLVKK